MKTSYLLLWFEGPLQSWGFDSRFSRRDTLRFPTKSGVYGLLLAATGASGAQSDLLSDLSGMRQSVIAYRPSDHPGTAPILEDFHMIGSGYNEKDPWQTLFIPKTSAGKAAVGGGSKLTYRYYLQDVAFAVIQEIPDSFVELMVSGLTKPVFPLHLGRKCCIPTEFIFQGVFQNIHSCEEAARNIAAEKSKTVAFRVEDGEHEGEVMTLNDVPLQFGSRKAYRDRTVTLIKE